MRAVVVLLLLAACAPALATDYSQKVYIVGDAGSSGTRLYLFHMEPDVPKKLGQCTSGKARLVERDGWTETVTDNAFKADELPRGSKKADEALTQNLARLLFGVCKAYLTDGTASKKLNDGKDHDKASLTKAEIMRTFNIAEADYARELADILKTARLFIGATAGARQIGANEPDGARGHESGSLDGVYFWDTFKSAFNLARGAAAEAGAAFTMEGREEALLGYTAAAIESQPAVRKNLLGFIEMGGASVQICVPNVRADTSFLETQGIIHVANGKLPEPFKTLLGTEALFLYCASLLGNANNRMLTQVTVNKFWNDNNAQNGAGNLKGKVMNHPCLPTGFSIAAAAASPTNSKAKWLTDGCTGGCSDSKALTADLATARVDGKDPKLMEWLNAGNTIVGTGSDAYSTTGDCGACAALVNQVYNGRDEVGTKSSSYAAQFKLIKDAVTKTWINGVASWTTPPVVFLNIKGVGSCNKFVDPAGSAKSTMAHAQACLQKLASYDGTLSTTNPFLFNERTMALNIKKIMEMSGLDNPNFKVVYGDAGWEVGLMAWLKKGMTVDEVMTKITSSHWRKDATAYEQGDWRIAFRSRHKLLSRIQHILQQ